MAPLPDILLGLLHRSLEFTSINSAHNLAKRTPTAAMEPSELRARTAATTTKQPDLGFGAQPPTNINNQIFLALFATVGALMVLASMYFFFVAKNGGFYWKENDWDDYKTTVLRRKGPNGTTLSNATKSTKLGGGSIVPKWAKSEYSQSTESTVDAKEMREMENGQAQHHKYRHSSRHDPELAAYKHEKVAKVGGINTSLHGTSQWDATNTDRSEVTAEPRSKKDKQQAAKEDKERKRREKEAQKKAAKDAAARAKEEKKARKQQGKAGQSRAEEPARPERAHRTYPSAAYSFHQGDDATSVYTSTNTATTEAYTQPSIRQVSYYESYRPSSNIAPIREQATPVSSHYSNGQRSASHHRQSRESMNNRSSARQSPSHSRQGSPRKQHRSSRPNSESASYTHTASSDTGTKVYTHHIPGLSKGEVGFDDSVSQAGANPRNRTAPSSSGYRRGGRGRRDSLSDSEM
jgi:hypothetical protein